MTDATYDAFMLDHASGALAPGMELLADMHVRLSMEGREVASAWNVIGGAILELGEAGLPSERRGTPARYRKRDTADDLLRLDLSSLGWRSGLSGVAFARTRTPHARFMRLAPGLETPRHGHSALEATLVLTGTLHDSGRCYERGQIAFGLPGVAHQPQSSGAETCVCFVASDRKPFWRLS